MEPDQTTPIPPRFGWLKRLSILAAVLVLTVVGLRLGWGYLMASRLNSAVEAIEAKGEPIHLADLKTKPVPPSDNAATYLRQALHQWPTVKGKAVVITETKWYRDRKKLADPIPDNEAYLKRCEKVFDLLGKAEQAPKVDWGVGLTSAGAGMPSPHLGDSRKLARLIQDAIDRAHADGDEQLAVKLLSRLLAIARTVETRRQFLIGHLVGVSIRAMVNYKIEEITPSLLINGDDSNAANSDQIRRLIDRLLDDEPERVSLTEALEAERVMMHAIALKMIKDPSRSARWLGGSLNQLTPLAFGPSWLSRSVYKPLFQHDARLMLRFYSAYVEAARQSKSLPEYKANAQQRTPANLREKVDAHPWLHPFTNALGPVAMDSVAVTSVQGRTRQQLAGLALAIRWYQQDHGGQRPATLADLKPKYIDEVPRDLMATTPRKLSYKPNGVVPRPAGGRSGKSTTSHISPLSIVYSVGEDGEDDGGLIEIGSSGKLIDGVLEAETDLYFLLEPPP